MKTIDLQVEGMSCGSCVKHVTHALQPLPGVSGVEVDLQSGHVRVSGELAQGSAPLLMALTDAGYPAKLATDTPIPAATSQPNRPLKKCFSNASGTLSAKTRAAQTRLRSDCNGPSGRFAGPPAHFGRTYPWAHA